MSEEGKDETYGAKLIEGAEDVFKGIASNIELIVGTMLAIVLQALSTIFSRGSEGISFDILLTVLEFIIGPFIMLVVFRAINEKVNNKMQKILVKYRECVENLDAANRKIQLMDYEHKIEVHKKVSDQLLQLEKLKYVKDVEIAQLNTSMTAKNNEILMLSNEISRLNKELALRLNS